MARLSKVALPRSLPLRSLSLFTPTSRSHGMEIISNRANRLDWRRGHRVVWLDEEFPTNPQRRNPQQREGVASGSGRNEDLAGTRGGYSAFGRPEAWQLS